MKIVDLQTISLSFHRIERRIHTKKPHTSQHRAGIQNGSHYARYVAQHPELSTHSLRKMSLLRHQARITRNTPTESKIGDADHQPANQTMLIQVGEQKKFILPLQKATDSTLEPRSGHEVKSSLETQTDVLRLINHLNRARLRFFFSLLYSKSNHTPEHPSRTGLSIEKGKKGERALACSNRVRDNSYCDGNVRQAVMRDCGDKSWCLSLHTEYKQQSRS